MKKMMYMIALVFLLSFSACSTLNSHVVRNVAQESSDDSFDWDVYGGNYDEQFFSYK